MLHHMLVKNDDSYTSMKVKLDLVCVKIYGNVATALLTKFCIEFVVCLDTVLGVAPLQTESCFTCTDVVSRLCQLHIPQRYLMMLV